AIRIAYGAEVPLPDIRCNNNGITKKLMSIFGNKFCKDVTPQWGREICSKALAMDTRNPSASMTELLHLLDVCWSGHILDVTWAPPDGLFSIEKRVCIGVLADMVRI
ncbi:hypothetical protein PMAYCL1PPCAC_04634, partial [Pristionchus mayeri]